MIVVGVTELVLGLLDDSDSTESMEDIAALVTAVEPTLELMAAVAELTGMFKLVGTLELDV